VSATYLVASSCGHWQRETVPAWEQPKARPGTIQPCRWCSTVAAGKVYQTVVYVVAAS
jgi:hypothetical protein